MLGWRRTTKLKSFHLTSFLCFISVIFKRTSIFCWNFSWLLYNMQENTALFFHILTEYWTLFKRRDLKFLFLLFTLCSFLPLSVFPLFCRQFLRCFSIRHVGSSVTAHPIKSKNIEISQPMKRRRFSQSNVTERQNARVTGNQRFVYKQTLQWLP